MAEIGATLREARMRARVDITQVESATKIRAKYLRAIEDEEWGVLPGPAYAKSFLREYADYLGLDSRMLVEEYKRRYEAPPDTEPIRPATGRRRERPRPSEPSPVRRWIPVAVVLVAIVAALFALGQTGGGGSKTHTTAHTAPTHRRARPRPAPPPAPTTVSVQIVPTGSVYVCLEDSAGRKLVPGVILTAGQPTRTFTARRMLLTLGNASARLRINGRLESVTPSTTAIGLELTPTGHHPLPAGRLPTCA